MIEDLAAQGGLAIVYTILGAAGASIVVAMRRERADRVEHAEQVDAVHGPLLRRTRLAQAGCGRPSWWPAGGDGEGGRAAHRADRDAVEQAEPAEPAPAALTVPWPEPFPTDPAEPTTPDHGSAPADHNQPPPVFAQPAYPGADTRAVGRHAVAPCPADVDIRALDADLRARLADPDRTELAPVVPSKDGAR